jgi:hypothetical protein
MGKILARGPVIQATPSPRIKPADQMSQDVYKKGNALVKDLFDYDTGSPATGLSPWKFLGEEAAMETKPM